MSAIELKNITKSYQKLKAVDNLSMTVESGEALVLVGPSGSGKTTILKIIAGLTPITSGSLLIDGKDAKDLKPRDREIGMVFQNYALYPNLNVYQNIAFGIDQKDKCRDQVLEAAELLQINANLKQKPGQLSGGQQQRVAIARAIARKPRLLLMDEPLSNLDAHLRNQMRMELNNLRSRLDATFVYVTHDQTEAMTLGDRIIVLNQGRCQQIGSPEAIYKNPQNLFTAAFMGNPAMNFFKAQLKGEKGQFELLFLGLSLRLPKEIQDKVRHLKNRPSDMIFGLRPEDIHLSQSEEKPSFLAKIEWIEWSGPESILHLKVDEVSFTMRLAGKFSTEKDFAKKDFISFDLLKIHLFNKNGERLL